MNIDVPGNVKPNTGTPSRAEDGFQCTYIKPHFLFSALNIISVLIPQEPAKAQELILNLSDLMRAAISQPGTSVIDLRADLDLAQYYAAIELERFKGKFTVDYRIDRDALVGARVPAFTLQSLLYNAIHRRILPANAPGKITVTARRANDAVNVAVQDNGIGLIDLESDAVQYDAGFYPPDLLSLQERLEASGLSGLRILSAIGYDSEISFEIPVNN